MTVWNVSMFLKEISMKGINCLAFRYIYEIGVAVRRNKLSFNNFAKTDSEINQ